MKKLQLIFASLIMAFTFNACSDDDDNNDLSCDDAIEATIMAGIEFNTSTSENYEVRCANYKLALQAQIESCGDTNGDLQAMIDDLGDCSLVTNPGVLTGVVSTTVGTLNKTFETNITMTIVGDTRRIRAEDDATSDWVEFDVVIGATGTNAISNFKIHLISSDYIPLPDDEGGDWTSSISVNSNTAIDGTFSGIVTSPSTGADIPLTSGIINIDL